MLFEAVSSFKGAGGSFLDVRYIYNLRTRPMQPERPCFSLDSGNAIQAALRCHSALFFFIFLMFIYF